MKSKKISIFLLVGFLATNLSLAELYFGGGVLFHKTNFKGERNFTTTSNTSVVSSEALDSLNEEVPFDVEDIKIDAFQLNFPQGSLSATDWVGCVSGDIIVSRPAANIALPMQPYECPKGGELSAVNFHQIMVNFGMKVTSFLKINPTGITNERFKEIAEIVFSYSPNGVDIPNSIADLTAIFDRNNMGDDLNPPFYQDGQNQNLYISINKADPAMLKLWQDVVSNIRGNLGGIIESNSNSRKIDDYTNGFGIFVNFGMLNQITNSKAFYGFESVFINSNVMLENEKMGNFKLTNNFAISLTGKLGYSFTAKSMQYLTLGTSLKEYKLKNNFNTSSKIVPYFLIGVGTEFAISPDYSFTFEYNYEIPSSKISSSSNFSDIDSPDGKIKDIRVSSHKVMVGVKYYVKRNPIYFL